MFDWLTAKEVANRHGVKVTRVRTDLRRNVFGERQRKTGSDKMDIWLIREDAAKEKYGEGQS